MASLDNRRRSPWREPMVWLLVAIPAMAVLASVALVLIAGRSSGTNDAIADPVQRTAQVQVADLGPDTRAHQLRLSAVVRFGKGLIEVLPVDGTFDRAAPLMLELRHPTHAAADRKLSLDPTATGWRVDGALDLSHDWNVQLGPTDGHWRLQGRWPTGQQATYLRPALDAPEAPDRTQ